MDAWGWGAAVATLSVAAIALFFVQRRCFPGRRPVRPDRAQARNAFQRRREWLEARFFTLASSSGKPRGLQWDDCDFHDEFVLARDCVSGQLRAFVGVTIRFQAVEGGEMEDNPNVANLREATAVFRYGDGQWDTDGRTVFNLNPAQTAERFHHEVETWE